ncbi:alpha/beta hydrolase family protein [Altererythrobacter sp. MF3-039]|uniref:alpha/beta hydrolase family protein n=1 Tax=Altererythrobacter sp. MF3-039 TaxID=3252901 RepID=UPI00390C90D7
MSYAEFLKIPQPSAKRTISYGGDELQRIELWLPQGEGPHPVVFMIHGGCWQTAVAKADIMGAMAQAFTERGAAVWNIEYRGIDVPGGGYPGTFHDVSAAARLLGERGQAESLDLDRVVAFGHSAGGHLGLWLAGQHKIDGTSPLQGAKALGFAGVVSIGGLPDLEEISSANPNTCGQGTIARLTGAADAARVDAFGDTSPAALLPLGVKQILIASAADNIAPPAYSQSYADKARAAGDTAEATAVTGQGHFELITPGTPAGDAVIEATLDLLGFEGS